MVWPLVVQISNDLFCADTSETTPPLTTLPLTEMDFWWNWIETRLECTTTRWGRLDSSEKVIVDFCDPLDKKRQSLKLLMFKISKYCLQFEKRFMTEHTFSIPEQWKWEPGMHRIPRHLVGTSRANHAVGDNWGEILQIDQWPIRHWRWSPKR